MAPIRIVALALAASTLAASGCGGNGNGGSQPSEILTRAELIVRADAICRRVNTLRNSITAFSQADMARVLPSFVSYERSALASLTKLAAPASMAGDWNEFLANFRTLTKDSQIVAEHAKSNTLNTVRGLSATLNRTRQRISVTAARDDLQACSQIAY